MKGEEENSVARTGRQKGSLFVCTLSESVSLGAAISVLVLQGKIPSRESSCGRPATVWESDVSVYRNLFLVRHVQCRKRSCYPCCVSMGKESVSSAVEQSQRESLLDVVVMSGRGGRVGGHGRWPGTAEVTERLRCAGCRA